MTTRRRGGPYEPDQHRPVHSGTGEQADAAGGRPGRRSRHDQTVLRAREALAQVATTARGEIPPLKVARWSLNRWMPAQVQRNFDGTLQIVIGAARAQAASDEELLGILAHEYAHFEYDDPEPTEPLRRAILAVAAQLGCLALAMAAGVVAGGILFGSTGKLLGLLLGGVLGISGFLLTDAYSRRRRFERTAGHDRPLLELRADLRAVQLVSRSPVLAMLDGHRAASQLDQRLHDIAPTHPTTELRRAVATNYEPTDDPLESARALRRQYDGK